MAIVPGEYADLVRWLDTNEDKVGTPEYVSKFSRWDELDKQQQRQPQPWTAAPEHNIDYGAPDEQVRAQIAGVTDERARMRAMNKWGDRYVEREVEQSPISTRLGDVTRAVAKGVPFVGSWLDELNAAAPLLGSPGGYDETVAYNRARDRNFQKNYPASNFGLNMMGGMAAPYLSYIKGLSTGGNIALGGAGGVFSGAGEGEGGWNAEGVANRGLNAAVGGGLGTALSSIFAPAAKFAERFNRSNVNPEVEAAGRQLGVELPFFLRSNDPAAQAAGQRATQSTAAIGSDLDLAYRALPQQMTEAGSRIVQGATGATPDVAPRVAGGVLEQAMPRVAKGIGDRMTQLTQDTASMLPPGYRADVPGLRGAYDRVLAERARDFNPADPAGMQWTENLVTAPGGVLHDTLDNYLSSLGRQIRRPNPFEPRVGEPGEMQGLYAGGMRDLEDMVRGAAGQPGVERMLANRDAQSALARLREDIANIAARGEPEALTNLVQSAASLKGGGTRLGTLANMANPLNPAERTQVGGGVLGNILNQTAVNSPAGTTGPQVMNPGAVAAKINQLVPEARNTLFQPGTPLGQGVDALATIGQRLAQISSQYAHVGTGRSMADDLSATATSPAGRALIGSAAAAAGPLLGLPPAVLATGLGLAAGGATGMGLKAWTPRAALHGLHPGWEATIGGAAEMLQPAAQQTQAAGRRWLEGPQ
jgi:hypothetical protein